MVVLAAKLRELARILNAGNNLTLRAVVLQPTRAWAEPRPSVPKTWRLRHISPAATHKATRDRDDALAVGPFSPVRAARGRLVGRGFATPFAI